MLGQVVLCPAAASGTGTAGGIMSDMTVIQVMLLICSLMCNVASMAYRLGKDVHGSARRSAHKGKRNNRRKRR